MTLPFITGNQIKFNLAAESLREFGVKLERLTIDFEEIQSETGEPIARHKAQQAFEQLNRPLVVNDDYWIIPALKGFPGPYMKSINTWFTPEDWLHLTKDLDDRRIILRQVVVYQDAHEQKLFAVDLEGILLREIRGKSPYAHSTITSLDGGEHSDAEYHEQNTNAGIGHHNAWHELGAWLVSQK
ncbi:MAG TPA: non-canonical purine NTP pyrophosphatase [Candidatus Saccharimonadales bacterium]